MNRPPENEYRALAKLICPKLKNGSRMAEVLLLSSKGRMKAQKLAKEVS